jgi:hypothetical protein
MCLCWLLVSFKSPLLFIFTHNSLKKRCYILTYQALIKHSMTNVKHCVLLLLRSLVQTHAIICDVYIQSLK